MTTILAYSAIVGAFFSTLNQISPTLTSATDSFTMDFTKSTTGTLDTTTLLASMNSEGVTLGIQPILSVEHAVLVVGSETQGLEVGNNTPSGSGKITFTIKPEFQFTKFTLDARFSNSPGTTSMKVTATYEPILNLTTPNPLPLTSAMTSSFPATPYSFDFTNPGSTHLVRQLSFEPNTTGSNTNFSIRTMGIVDSTTEYTQKFEEKVLSYSPCRDRTEADANTSITALITPEQATALRNEYLALKNSSKVKFELTKNDPTGPYQRYVFICSKFGLTPFSI